MINIKDFGFGIKGNCLTNNSPDNKENTKIQSNENQFLVFNNNFSKKKNSQNDVLISPFQNNLSIQENEEFKLKFMSECQNIIDSYYSSTVEYFKNTEKYYKICYSKNYIPKKKSDIIQNDGLLTSKNINKKNEDNNFINANSEIKKIEKNIEFNKNYLFNHKKKDLNNYFLNEQINIINTNENYKKKLINFSYINNNGNIPYSKNILIDEINYPPFIPSNFNKKKIYKSDLREIREVFDKEISSNCNSQNNSPFISQKKTNIFTVNVVENNDLLDSENNDYLIEMFGRKGWICILCNNFNYETRVKCNRCGLMKKPKKIVNKKSKIEENNKERNNKKGDWVCTNCNNLNYSFRTVCNRCKTPKIFFLISNPFTFKGEFNINSSNDNFPLNCISPSIIVLNNLPNAFIK